MTKSLSDTPTPAPFPVNQLTGALDNPLVVLLGDQDILQGPNFRTTDAANAQGDTRFSRGQFYYSEGEAEATARNVQFGWDMKFVRGVGHSGSEMAKSAANLFRFAVEGPPPPIIDFPFNVFSAWDSMVRSMTPAKVSGSLATKYSPSRNRRPWCRF